ncbi:MAG: phosphate signaling complex protein PhoU [Rhodobacteraceae bacterium]|nr:phosphate signaling complex protein PhoU [Paracoccaceae bacterium]
MNMIDTTHRAMDADATSERGVSAELRELSAKLSAMSGLAEAQLTAAIDALAARDTELAERVVAGDAAIDDLETDINARAMGMLTRHAPVAADLREIVAALKISSNIERIGDYAANIAKRAVIVNGYGQVPAATGVIELGHLVRQYTQTVFDAYVERNVAKAESVWRGDAEIDALHTSVFQDLLSDMLVEHDYVLPCTHLLFCIKNLERIGDHATNVAETIQFLVAGTQLAERRRDKNGRAQERASIPLTTSMSADFHTGEKP